MKLRDFENYRKNKQKSELLIDAQSLDPKRLPLKMFDQPAGGARPCGNANGGRYSSASGHADVIGKIALYLIHKLVPL